MTEDESIPNQDQNPPILCIEFLQGETSLGVVTTKEFYNSGEVENTILPEAVRIWNQRPENVKEGVRAAIVIRFKGFNYE